MKKITDIKDLVDGNEYFIFLKHDKIHYINGKWDEKKKGFENIHPFLIYVKDIYYVIDEKEFITFMKK
jgi:hypothetical protein